MDCNAAHQVRKRPRLKAGSSSGSDSVIEEPDKQQPQASTQMPSANMDKAADRIETNASIDGEFFINAIKSQDDSIRQVMSITGLILGAYVTIVANNYDKLTSWISSVLSSVNVMYHTLPFLRPFVQPFLNPLAVNTVVLLSVPAVMWLGTFFIAIIALHPTTQTATLKAILEAPPMKTPPKDKQIDFLIEIAENKYGAVRLAIYLMVFGLFSVFYGAIYFLSFHKT